MNRWTEFELFVKIAELGSLSVAAEKLDISNASASRFLASLETRLNARLIERNTRGLTHALIHKSSLLFVRLKSA